LSTGLMRRRLLTVIEPTTAQARGLGRRRPIVLSRMLFVVLLVCVSKPVDAGIQTWWSPTIQKHDTVKRLADRSFPNPYATFPNPFTVKPDPYGAWPNPFTAKPNPYGALPDPFLV
jgi:hypothetical protein